MFNYSERSDECIDFTMLTCRNNALISNFGGGFRGSFFEFPNSFQKRREKPKKKKIRKNGNFYAKPVFNQIDFFIWFITSQNNASISNFREVKSKHFPTVTKKKKKSRKTKKKNTKKKEFSHKTSIRQNLFFYMVVTCYSKTNHCKYLKFSPNVFISVIYIHVDKNFLAQ
ncbi:Uncharacterized protein FWK35_00008910 [Aphis craccivora]|uniref:Uncharacterized protein n=1 Tax=Aphis craccivora TaxID=307492 RepID=A0A6G0ZEH3_APHCR|nr:Uncharacterized protein FWK35_00008910 [Aphis craccivora]